MTRNAIVREHLRLHPGSIAGDVAAATGMPVDNASKAMSGMHNHGFLTRVLSGKSLTNVPRYAYTLTDKVPSPGGPKRGCKQKPKVKQTNVIHSDFVPPQPFLAAKPVTAPQTLDNLVESIASALVAQLVAQVRAKLPDAFAASFPTPSSPMSVLTPMESLLTAIAAPRPRTPSKPRVGVVGLLPVQAGEISKTFGVDVDLQFWNDGEDKGKLRNIADACEVVFLHVRHSGHHTDQVLKAHGANIRRVTGGVSQMKFCVKTYFQTRTIV